MCYHRYSLYRLSNRDVYKRQDEGNEKYKLVDGERRYRATMLAISEGADIPYVRAMKARKGASTEELYIQQMMRNEGKKITIFT